MKSKIIFGLVMIVSLGTVAQAQYFSAIVDASDVIPVTGRTNWDPEALTVRSNGTIFVVDADEAANDRLLKIVPGTPNVVTLLTTEDDIVNAVNAVNGTGEITDYSIASVDVAADGDIILVNSDAANEEVVVAVDRFTGAISVIYTPMDGALSAVEGAVSATVIGNTLYIGRYEVYGAFEHDVVRLDTNDGAAPSAVVTQLVSEAALAAVNGAEDNVSTLSNDGTNLIGGISGGGTSTDNIVRITTAGVVSLHVAASDILADIGDDIISISGIAVDKAGRIWFPQVFGGTLFEDGIVFVNNPGGGVGDATAFTEAQIVADIGIPGLVISYNSNMESTAYDPANHRILISNTDEYGGSDNLIIAVDIGAFLDVKDWQQY